MHLPAVIGTVMKCIGIEARALFCAVSLMLSGCNGGGTTPSPSASPANISGDYVGSMQDAQSGSGAATATLAQHGSAAGGAITAQLAGANVTAQISLAITPANALSGAMVVDYADGTTCTFSTSGNYTNNGSAAIISGSYTAVTNCAGDTGTYVLNQQCVDTIASADRRIMSFPPKC